MSILPEYVTSIYEDLEKARAAEKLASQRRMDSEARMIAAIREQDAASVPQEGSKTYRLADGRKVCLKAGLSYKADINAIMDAIKEEWSKRKLGQSSSWLLPPPVKITTKEELDLKGYEWYRKEHPDIFSMISKHVTVTPKKIGVTIS